MKFSPPKGTQDLWNSKFYAYEFIAQTIIKVTQQYGFRQLRTPGFETIEILAKNAGSEITNQIYTLKDKGRRNLGIKSDITPAVARFIAGNSKSMLKPIKISCYDRIYRYERPQSGRNREITQVNAELFGAKPGLVEADLLACFYQCYQKLNLPEVKIEIGFRPLLEKYIQLLEVSDNQVLPIIRLIDKKDKIGRQEFIKSMSLCGVTKNKLQRIQKIIDLKGNLTTVINQAKTLSKDKQLNQYLQQLNVFTNYLKLYGIENRFTLNLGLARAFEYYTGIIFEAKIPGSKFGSIGGGGRYDNLVKQYGGPDTPAIGFSIGIDRVYLVLQEFNRLKNISLPKINYYLISNCKTKSLLTLINQAQKLRSLGQSVEIDILNKTPKEQLINAKKLQAEKIINF